MPPAAIRTRIRASAGRRLLAAALLCCVVAQPARPADAPPVPNSLATLIWLARAPADAAGAGDPLDIAELAPALARRGVTVRAVPAAAPGSLRTAVADALQTAGTGERSAHRIAVGTAGDDAAAVLALAQETPAIAAIVLLEPGLTARLGSGASLDSAFELPTSARAAQAARFTGHPTPRAALTATDPVPVPASLRTVDPVRVPLLQVFDARCDGARDMSPARPAIVDGWLRARWGAAHADARRTYAPLGDAQGQCRALRDARFVDGMHARARAAAMLPKGPATWLALREDEAPAATPSGARAGMAAQAAPADSLVARTLTSTLADYVAAFILNGDPAVRGRPNWPAFDDGARRYLQLGVTVRTTRDPLIDVLDLQATLDATTSPATWAAPVAAPAAGTATRAAATTAALPPVSSAAPPSRAARQPP